MPKKPMLSLCVSLALAFWARPALATIFQVLPTHHAVDGSGNLYLKYDLPCGSLFRGVLLRATGPGELKVGILVQHQLGQCAGLSRPSELVFDRIDTRKFTKISPINPFYISGTVRLAKVLDYRPVRKGNGHTVQIVYQRVCGKEVGALVLPRGARDVAVGYVEETPRGHGAAPCKPVQVVGNIPNFRYGKGDRLSPISIESTQLEEAFSMRLAKIDPTSIERAGPNKLKISYVRRCNEAPVGAVTRLETAGDTQRVAIGMVVARYYNAPCGQGTARRLRSSYVIPFIALARGTHVRLMKPTSAFSDLYIKTPLRYSYDKKASARGLTLTYYGGCDTEIGSIVREDAAHSPWLGILARRPIRPCKKPVDEVSLKQPYFVNKTPSTTIRALTLTGA